MSSDANKAIVRSLFAAFNTLDVAAVDVLVAAKCVDHVTVAGQAPGRVGIKQRLFRLRVAFPDVRLTVEDLLADGDRVAVRWTLRGTHQGSWLGVPPTGRPVAWTGCAIYRLARGKIVERWAICDNLDLWRQLSAEERVPSAEC